VTALFPTWVDFKDNLNAAPNPRERFRLYAQYYDPNKERKQENKLDGSSGYQDNFRAQGKFGFHPMYDGMGDESRFCSQ
jgi:hypothetical protein